MEATKLCSMRMTIETVGEHLMLHNSSSQRYDWRDKYHQHAQCSNRGQERESNRNTNSPSKLLFGPTLKLTNHWTKWIIRHLLRHTQDLYPEWLGNTFDHFWDANLNRQHMHTYRTEYYCEMVRPRPWRTLAPHSTDYSEMIDTILKLYSCELSK